MRSGQIDIAEMEGFEVAFVLVVGERSQVGWLTVFVIVGAVADALVEIGEQKD